MEESTSSIKIKHGDYLHALRKSKKLFLFSDKTSNIYQIETDKYSILIPDTIGSTYKKIPDKISNKINTDGKKIIEN